VTPQEAAQRCGGAVEKSGQWHGRCPAHDDKDPSLAFSIGEKGDLVWYCRAGCDQRDVQAALERLEIIKKSNGRDIEGGITLQIYAASKGLPETFLKELGIYQTRYNNLPALAMPYPRADNSEPQIKFRVALSGKSKTKWKKGHKACLYAEHKIIGYQHYVIVAEGESDTQTLILAKYNAVGLPGSGGWKEEYVELFSHIPIVYFVIEPDDGGRNLLRDLTASAIASKARLVRMSTAAKDPSELYLRDQAGFAVAFEALLIAAEPIISATLPKTKPEPYQERRWLNFCATGTRGDTLMNVENVFLGLRSDEEIKGLLFYNEMLRCIMLSKEVPIAGRSGRKSQQKKYPRPMTDQDVTLIQEWLQIVGLQTVSLSTVRAAVEQVAMESLFHPVKEYLESLSWDGIDRVDGWLTTYLGAEESDYSSLIGRMFLIAMMARIYQPGCQADYIMILEGPQGTGKSSACRILGSPWFSDSLPDIARAGKDVSMHLNGKWLIEIPELSALDRAETTALKAFVTRPIEQYRPSYGRQDVFEPRQCVFIGTTNASVYLRDSTGGRRFWPVKVAEIKLDELARDRDQILSEALSLYRGGLPWWPDREFEEAFIAPEQDARYEADEWETIVEGYLRVANFSRTTLVEVAKDALKFNEDKLSIADQRRISRAMERAGWKRIRTNTERFWARP